MDRGRLAVSLCFQYLFYANLTGCWLFVHIGKKESAGTKWQTQLAANWWTRWSIKQVKSQKYQNQSLKKKNIGLKFIMWMEKWLHSNATVAPWLPDV